MAPVNYNSQELHLPIAKRDGDSDPPPPPVETSGCSGLFCNGDYSRWIILIIVVLTALGVAILVWYWTILRRARRGTPLAGTAWMVPVSTLAHTSDDAETQRHSRSRHGRGRNSRRHRNRHDEEADPVPTYHAELGEGDAGFYDSDGHYVAHVPPPYHPDQVNPPPKAVVTDTVNPVGEHIEDVCDSLERTSEDCQSYELQTQTSTQTQTQTQRPDSGEAEIEIAPPPAAHSRRQSCQSHEAHGGTIHTVRTPPS